MFLRVPLALPEQLQAGAVQHEVHRLVAPGKPGLAASEGATTPGQRGVTRDGQFQAKQAQRAADERLSLTHGQVEDDPQGQRQLDRQVGTAGLSTRRGPARCLPASECCIAEPGRQVAASPQPGLVGWPVRHPHLCFGMRRHRAALHLHGMHATRPGYSAQATQPPPCCTSAAANPNANTGWHAPAVIRALVTELANDNGNDAAQAVAA